MQSANKNGVYGRGTTGWCDKCVRYEVVTTTKLVNVPITSSTYVFSRYMKRRSPSLIIREPQIKTTTRYDLTPARLATIKRDKT